MSISSLNIDQFLQFFHLWTLVCTLLILCRYIHYFVKYKYPKTYNITHNNLHAVADMDCLDNCYTHCDCGRVDIIDKYYMCVVYALQNAAAYYVPRKKASFYKFWWDVEASELKYKSIDAHRLWVAAGRPRIGDCFTTPCLKKTKQICFCQNCVKFPPILIILGRRMANNPNICEVHSFSISPNLRHHLTVLNVNVPNCYITPNVVILSLIHISEPTRPY